MSKQSVPFGKFLEERKRINKQLEINIDLKRARKAFVILIVICGLILFPQKVY